jgi:hypothetical protein
VHKVPTLSLLRDRVQFTSSHTWIHVSSFHLRGATGYRRTSVVWLAAGTGEGLTESIRSPIQWIPGALSSGIKCPGADDPTRLMQGLRLHRPLHTQENIFFSPILTYVYVSLMIASLQIIKTVLSISLSLEVSHGCYALHPSHQFIPQDNYFGIWTDISHK